MVKSSAPTLDRVFAALADPTRRAILERLRHSDCAVGQLAEPFAMSWPAVSKHLRVLERAALVSQTRRGRVRLCRLEAEPLKLADDWVQRYRQFWTNQLDALADFLEATPPETPPDAPPDPQPARQTRHRTPTRRRQTTRRRKS